MTLETEIVASFVVTGVLDCEIDYFLASAWENSIDASYGTVEPKPKRSEKREDS